MTRALAIALLSTGIGCAGAPPRVDFVAPSGLVPSKEYPAVHERWTRHVRINHDWDAALDAHVTLLSDEMRAAYAVRLADLRALAPMERQVLVDQQRLEGTHFVEFVIELDTTRYEWNDLSSPQTLWTITLRDSDGREIGRPEVQPVIVKPEQLKELFPPLTPFTRTWRVRFPEQLPDGTRLLSPSTKWVTLRFAGPLGQGDVRWDSR